eukprot:maker-scaffold110_size354795-snap-gene-0.15 protein:Tk03427 transcript:maker-scaffold110_size354795-snap-gene-0.15-mRNA-1 annotation:"hypothetical protein"
MSHIQHPIYQENMGLVHHRKLLSLPPQEGLSVRINEYLDVPEEPIFDPKAHLDLQSPKYVRLLKTFEKTQKFPKANADGGSDFAYSAPFQVLSSEGVRVVKEIVMRNEKSAVGPEFARGQKLALRGLYYLSPFVRDFQNCPELADFFQEMVGEKLIPACCFSNVPQVNLSVLEKPSSGAPLDNWHWDSVAYTGVILLNDMTEMVGGELEIMLMDKKKALRGLEEGIIENGSDSEIISYEQPGKMIFAQGSEILHHVTQVQSDHRRISMIMAYSPANCFQPPKSVLATMRRVDNVHKLGDYEYFREKAWQCSNALNYYVENIQYSNNGHFLARKLRVIAQELVRTADILDSKADDMIKFYDEVNKKVSEDYNSLSHKTK